jgi:hypothetical protein
MKGSPVRIRASALTKYGEHIAQIELGSLEILNAGHSTSAKRRIDANEVPTTTPLPGLLALGCSMSFTTIEVNAVGVRGTITLNRPDKLNALSTETLSELAGAASWFDERSNVKVVVVSGTGRAFSSGADVSVFAGADPGVVARREAADAGRSSRCGLSRSLGSRAIASAVLWFWLPRATCAWHPTRPGSRFPRSISGSRWPGVASRVSFARSGRP